MTQHGEVPTVSPTATNTMDTSSENEKSVMPPVDTQLSPRGSSEDQLAASEKQDASSAEIEAGEKGADAPKEAPKRLSGGRLVGVTAMCLLSIFLASLEVAIIPTALIAISDELQSFNLRSWMITAYLLTYTGFVAIWSKLSDTFGRRPCICASIVVFTIASGACGGSRNIQELLVFRAFQGIGGAGLLSLTYVILPEMIEVKQYAIFGMMISLSLLFSYVVGPILGGAIVQHTTWRWIFYINIPLGVITAVILFTFMPAGFPDLTKSKAPLKLSKLKEIDYVGAILILGVCAFLVSALETAASDYSWSSPLTVTMATLGGLCVVLFPVWEYFVDRRLKGVQPIFTPRLMRNRIYGGVVITAFFSGTFFTIQAVNIPQEYQTVLGVSALTSGVMLLPFILFASVGTVMAMMLTTRLKVPIVCVLLGGAMLQVAGMAPIAFVPLQGGAGRYICDMIAGAGVGLNLGLVVPVTPLLVGKQDHAAGMGLVTQGRSLGGVLGVAITTNVFSASITSTLSTSLLPTELHNLLQSFSPTLALLTPEAQATVRQAFASAYTLQNEILLGFALAQALTIILIWEYPLRKFP